jgi:alkylation response protein AidB-like acyl-CoA dehydrogenase
MYTMGTLLRHGSLAQKQQYLPDIAAGSLRLQAFGVTEPKAGTDTSSIETFATKVKNGYVINGHKIWTSRVAHSDLMLLLARTQAKDSGTKKTDGMSVFLIDLREAIGQGLTIKPIEAMLNRHSAELFLEDVWVPADSLVGEADKGFRCILDGMNAERILLSYECVGDAAWFIEKARTYAAERQVFGRPIGQNQGVQFPIARCYAETQAAALVVEKAAKTFDAGQPCGTEANIALLLSSEASWHAAEVCLQTYGGYGFATSYDIERKYREARLYRIAPLSTNLILSYIGEHVLELPRSY